MSAMISLSPAQWIEKASGKGVAAMFFWRTQFPDRNIPQNELIIWMYEDDWEALTKQELEAIKTDISDLLEGKTKLDAAAVTTLAEKPVAVKSACRYVLTNNGTAYLRGIGMEPVPDDLDALTRTEEK